MLAQFDLTCETMIATDASTKAIAGTLSRCNTVKRAMQLYSVECNAKTLSAVPHNWPIDENELFATVDSFQQW